MTDAERAKQLCNQLLADLKPVPRNERFLFLKGWYAAIKSRESAEIADYAYSLYQLASFEVESKVVISLHGIRTRGTWQKELAGELSRAGFIPEALDYGFFRAIKLLIPYCRSAQVDWL